MGIIMEKRYMISDAAKLVDVEAHVLRYWEEELSIEIPRNEMGHRYYTDHLINTFKEIKELKDQGFLLKAIKMLLPEISQGKSITPTDIKGVSEVSLHIAEDTSCQPVSANDKMEQFQMILGNIVTKALEENNSSLGQAVSNQVSDSVIKQMDYLLRLKEEREEDRFKRLDETIRNYQRSKKEIAAASEKKSHGLFSRRKDR